MVALSEEVDPSVMSLGSYCSSFGVFPSSLCQALSEGLSYTASQF